MNAAEIVKRATALRDSEFSTQEELLQAYTRVANMVKDAQNTDVDDTLLKRKKKRLYMPHAWLLKLNCLRPTPFMTTVVPLKFWVVP